jgi:hypothetical protein
MKNMKNMRKPCEKHAKNMRKTYEIHKKYQSLKTKNPAKKGQFA